jgi:tetratricopeptide (TPR) repeat protein
LEKRKRKPKAQQSSVAVSTPAKLRTGSVRKERREDALKRSEARSRERLLLIAVLAVSALAFANALDGQFVYDDRLQVIKNPTLNSLSNIPRMFTQGVWQFLNETDKTAVGPYYRPVFNIALIVNRHLFGLEVAGWHLVSIAVHLCVVFLVYQLARKWELSFEVAAASALLFGLHPVHSESIAWVSALPDPLAALFILSSLLLYEHYYDKGAIKNPVTLYASVVLALLAMASKEVAVIYPAFLVAREALGRNRENIAELASRVAKRTAPFFAVVLVYLSMRYYVLGFIRQDEPKSAGISFLQVLITIPSVLLSYVRMFVAPYPLAVLYPNTYLESARDARFWAAGLVIIVLVVGVWLIVRKSPTALLAYAFMIVFIVPVLNLKAFRPEESLLHDRYLYLPSVGFSVLVAMGFDWLSARFSDRRRRVFVGATMLVGVVLLVLTYHQNFSWQNELAMVDYATKVAPRWPFLQNYVGAYYAEQRKFSEAERAYLSALELDPKYYDSHSNLGDIYREQGNLRTAENHYLKAIEYGAPYAETYYNLGVTYVGQNRLADAEQPLLRALEIRPAHVKARYNLGWVYDQQGKNMAEQAYSETLERDPAYPEPRINLAILLTKQKRYDEAMNHLRIAQRYAPDHPVLLYALGDLNMRTGRYEEAITIFKQVDARKLHQNIVHTNLGLCYENIGRKDDAKLEFQKAVDIAPQDTFTLTAREHLAKLQGGS